MGAYTAIADVHEEAHTQLETYDAQGGVATAQVVLRCAWGDRHSVVSDILSNFRAWPHSGGINPAIAQRCGIRPAQNSSYTVSNSACVYEQALVTVDYTTDTEQLIGATAGSNGLKYSDSIEPLVEFSTLDPARFRWTNANGALLRQNEAPGRQMHKLSLVRTIYNMPSIPASALTLGGTVNSVAYVSSVLGLTFAIETLLFNPPTIQRNTDISGSVTQNVTVKFAYQAAGWNKFWNQQAKAYAEIYDVEAGAVYKNFPPQSFADWLFI